MANQNIIRKSALTPTVLIAGGAGFIGSNLAETLLLQNARVVVLDNFSTGSNDHISSLLNNPKFALFNVDINVALPQEIESVDYVFHLAGVETYLSGHDEVSLNSLLTNSLGTKNLLDLANKSNAKFLLVSSTNIYQGMISSLNLDRYFGATQQEQRKYSLAEAKRYAEALVGEYYKRYKTNVRIARIPEVYGPRMDMDSAGPLTLFFKELLEDKDLTIYGEGTEKEYYIYITDAVTGIIKSIFNEHTEGKIYSLINNDPFSTLELAYLVKSVAHRELNINFKPKTKSFDTLMAAPDTSNLTELNWEPKVDLKEGLGRTLKWLGYETNENAFKPAQLIQKKDLEKQSTTNLFGEVANTNDTNITNENIEIAKQVTLKKPSELKESFLRFGHKVESIVNDITSQHTSNIQDNTGHEDKATFKPMNTKTKSVAAILAAVVVLFTVFVGIPTIQTYVYVKNAYTKLQQVPENITQLDSVNAAELSNEAYKNLHKAQKAYRRLSPAFTVVGQKNNYLVGQNLLSSAKYFTKATYYGAKAVKPFESIVQVIRPDSKEVLEQSQIEESQLYLTNAKNELQLASGEFKKIDISKIPAAQRDKVTMYEQALSKAQEGVELAEAFAIDMPNLFGLDAPKRYLVLFQNSNEIRPTGGFIGSYAVLEMDKGKITSLTIDDIYNPDGQLDIRNIVVTPPQPIASLLDEDRLHIRNANWSPDFTDSANKIQDLFFRIDGSTFNGVIAVDLYFAQNLLKVTGPIFLTAYNEELTADNLYERTQVHSEFNYEEGSSQKKSFLTVLGSKLLEKLFALSKDKMPILAQETENSLNEKHLLIHLNNSSFSTLLANKNWGGRLVDTEKDYLYVVNANLGGTKANYYVHNSMKYEVSSATRDGILRSKLTLTYKHTGEDFAWPGGPYTNYLRVLVPKDAKLNAAKLYKNGKYEPDEVIRPLTESEAKTLEKATPEERKNLENAGNAFKDVVIASVNGYTTFEIPFTLLPKEELQLEFEYDLPPTVALSKDDKKYSLYWQKQPGTNKDNIEFKFNYPFGLVVEATEPKMEQTEEYLYIADELNADKQLEVRLR